MTCNDPIAEMFARITNAFRVRHKSVSVPFSKLKFEIIKILKNEGFIKDFEVKEEGNFKKIEVALSYDKNGKSVLNKIIRVSKPGRRVYLPYQEIKPVLDGFGIAIISTSKGLMVDRQARRQKLGGEVIAEVY